MRTHFPCSFAPVVSCWLALTVTLAQGAPPAGELVQRSYHIADLVVPLARAEATVAAKSAQPGETAQAQATLEDRLMTLVVQSIRPASWQPNGGAGTLHYFASTMSLVINQTPEVHDQIAALLAELRKPQETQVALEVRFVTIAEPFFERIGIDFNHVIRTKDASGQEVIVPQRIPSSEETVEQCLGQSFLNDKQLHLLMEAARGDQRTHFMQAPKLTLFNGQVGTVNVTDSQHFLTGIDVVRSGDQVVVHPKNEPAITGFRMTAQPVVSADRRFVQLYLKIDQTDLASTVVPLIPVTVPIENGKGRTIASTQYLQQPTFTTMAVEKTVAVPDGGTVLFGGFKRLIEGRNESGPPPVLSKIPYLNRCFKTVGYGREWEQVVILVTPRILTLKEPEQATASTAATERAYDQVQKLSPGSGYAQLIQASQKQMEQQGDRLALVEKKTPTNPEMAAGDKAKLLAELLQAYDQACGQGRTDQAQAIAREALLLDPTCFSRRR